MSWSVLSSDGLIAGSTSQSIRFSAEIATKP